ncbi:MAG: hypothetical protein ACFB12_24120 [Leptolyngbyaceae cyanobacterium]
MHTALHRALNPRIKAIAEKNPRSCQAGSASHHPFVSIDIGHNYPYGHRLDEQSPPARSP